MLKTYELNKATTVAVSSETRHKVKVYAANHDITCREVIEAAVDMFLDSPKARVGKKRQGSSAND